MHKVAHVHAEGSTRGAAVAQQVLRCTPKTPRAARGMPYSKISSVQNDADLLMVTARLDGLVHKDSHGREGG